MRPNLICHFVHNLENLSGAAFQGKILADSLNETGEFCCFVINKSAKNKIKKEWIGGTEVYHVPKNIFLRIFVLFIIYTYKRFSIVHIHGYEDAVFIVSILFNKRILLKSTIIGEDFESLGKKRNFFGSFNFLLKKISFNNALTSSIYNINKKYVDNIDIIPNFVEHEVVNFTNKEPIFIIVGAVCPRKRSLEAIKYFKNKILDKDLLSRLLIVGPYGPSFGEYDKEYIDSCLSEAADCNNIEFIGLVPKLAVYDLLVKAKAILFFSSREGFGSVIIESILCNCVPIIMHDNLAAHDIILNNKNGIILSSLSEQLDLQLVDTLVSSGLLPGFAADYTLEKILVKYLEVYRKMSKNH